MGIFTAIKTFFSLGGLLSKGKAVVSGNSSAILIVVLMTVLVVSGSCLTIRYYKSRAEISAIEATRMVKVANKLEAQGLMLEQSVNSANEEVETLRLEIATMNVARQHLEDRYINIDTKYKEVTLISKGHKDASISPSLLSILNELER